MRRRAASTTTTPLIQCTVQYGAIEIGFWRVGSSFLKPGVKSGQVGSSFLKNRNPPPRNFASPPLRRRTTRVQRGDVPMHLHQPMGHSEQSKQAWHPTALYHTASGELSGDPSIPPVISPPCLTSWSLSAGFHETCACGVACGAAALEIGFP